MEMREGIEGPGRKHNYLVEYFFIKGRGREETTTFYQVWKAQGKLKKKKHI